MECLQCETSEPLLLVRLTRGKANALNAQAIEELIKAFGRAAADDAVRGVVLGSASERFFSSGFDVVEVFGYERDAMRTFFGRFIDLYETIRGFAKPVVAAIGGHTFAGGAVLALACDERIVSDGQYGFALNEVNLGVVLPPGVLRMAVDIVGPRHARELLLDGKTLSPARLVEIGPASEKVADDALWPRAIARAHELAEKPPQAFAAIKGLLVQPPGTAAASDRAWLDEFLAYWFSPEALARKAALLQSMKR